MECERDLIPQCEWNSWSIEKSVIYNFHILNLLIYHSSVSINKK